MVKQKSEPLFEFKKSFRKIFIVLITLLTVIIFNYGCEYLKSKSNKAEETMVKPEGNNSPNYVGTWTTEKTIGEITITKVSDKLYDVKLINPNTNEEDKDMSGPYTMSDDGKNISKPVPLKKNSLGLYDPKDNGKVYQLNYTDDGRLYANGHFFNRK